MSFSIRDYQRRELLVHAAYLVLKSRGHIRKRMFFREIKKELGPNFITNHDRQHILKSLADKNLMRSDSHHYHAL
jgi:hypothetical protein